MKKGNGINKVKKSSGMSELADKIISLMLGGKRKKRNKPAKHDYVLWTIRGLLVISIVINLSFIIYKLIENDFNTSGEIEQDITNRLDTLFWSFLTLGITLLHDYFEKHKNIHIPDILEVIIIVFIYASIFLSVQFDLYYELFWWDVLLHGSGGAILAFVGFLLIYKFNSRHSMNINPFFVAAFAFCFSLAVNVIFEIYEFSLDLIFRTALQSWDLPSHSIEIGFDEQGMGLRDTMSDLISDTAGAFIVSVLCYFLFKNEKKKSLKVMQEMFPEKK